MADVKISALPAVVTVVPGTDVLPLVSNITGTSTTTKATPQSITNAALLSPGPIGSGAANTGSFTTLTVTGTTTLATALSGILKGTSGVVSTATAGTDYTTPTGTENINNKTITASTINSTTIGASSAAAGTFTQLAYTNDAPGITTIVTAAGTTTLTNTSTFYQRFTGSTTQTIKLPDETTIPAGTAYVIDNDSTGIITVQDSAGGALATVATGMAGYVYSVSNSAATGNWVGYAYVPGAGPSSQILWGTAGLDLGGGYAKSGAFQLASNGITTDATTTRTLSAVDNGKVLYFTSGSAITVTTAVSLGAGFSCTIIQGGAGQITVAQGASTTLVSYGTLVKTAGQYALASIICPVADTFYLAGNLGA